MAYDYYCTNCGSRVNEETVLFDMQELFTGDASKKFQILKFRMTEQELRAFLETGEPLPDGSYRCSLTFPQLMEYISRKHNLNIPAATELTMEDVVAFMDDKEPEYYIHDDDEDLFDEFSLVEELENPEIVERDEFWARAIEDMIREVINTYGREWTERILREDLGLVCQLLQDGDYRFIVKLRFEEDDKGNAVLYGMNIGRSDGRNTQLENRVCPICGGKIYPHAGTAEHKAVVFIGERFSGIEDVIAALSHYALNHLQFDCGSPVWHGAATISDVEEIALLAPTRALRRKLLYYDGDSYSERFVRDPCEGRLSATFLIKTNCAGMERRRILTMTELPKECLAPGGHLSDQIFCGWFEIVSACEAIVVCSDASRLRQELENSGEEKRKQEDNGYQVLRFDETVRDTCLWTDKFQTKLMQICGKKAYVPTMALINHARELETDDYPALAIRARYPMKEIYMFSEEAAIIERTREYEVLLHQLIETGGMKDAFLAAMRCSPFGYRIPGWYERTQSEQRCIRPRPRNMDKLMHWILMVTGCVPVKARYRPRLVENHFYQLNDYYMDRIQYRRENPRYNGKNSDEALARCALFSNPGEHDKMCVVKMDDAVGSYVHRMKMNLRPDSNAQ